MAMKIKNAKALRRQITDAFSERGAKVAEALRALLDELEDADVEIDETQLADKVNELIKAAADKERTETEREIEEKIANTFAKKFAAIQNNIKKELPLKVRNEIATAIFRSGSKERVEDAVKNVLVKNDITGYSFSDVVDFAIVENWGDMNPLFSKLHKTFYTKFFYNSEDLKNAALLAKQWNKESEVEKAIQEITITGKALRPDYIYKRQRAAFADLDEIEEAGETANFMTFINEELERMIINSIIMAMLIGDNTNDQDNKITTFETIGTKTESDAFTTVLNPETDTITLADLRRLADSVQNPNSKEKVLIISNALLSMVAQFTYAEGGSVSFRSREEVAAQLGVDEIITTDLLNVDNGIYAIAMLPDGYWYKERKALSVSYPQYDKNAMNYQKEKNIAGAIHDLYSTAVLRVAAESED